MTSDLAIMNAATYLAEEVSGAAATLAFLNNVQIKDQDDLTWAANQIQNAKGRWNTLEASRKDLKAPALESARKADALFKPALDFYAEAERVLKSKLGEYHTAQEKARLAIVQASAAEYAQGGTPTAVIPAPTAVQGITVRYVQDFEITSPDVVPQDLCSPDPAKIKAALALGVKTIPGVHIFQREIVTARKAGT